MHSKFNVTGKLIQCTKFNVDRKFSDIYKLLDNYEVNDSYLWGFFSLKF